jgi:TRAP transporter 4TM/12TM fusion protein
LKKDTTNTNSEPNVNALTPESDAADNSAAAAAAGIPDMTQETPSGPLCGPARVKRWTVTILAGALTVFAFFNQIVARYVGVFLYTEQYVMIFIGISMFLLFFTNPAKKEYKDKWTPWDVVPAGRCLFACLYVAWNWEMIYYQPANQITTFQLVLGVLVILFMIEACRRTVGWPMICVILLFLAYTFFGNNLSGALRTSVFTVGKVVHYVYLTTSGLFGMPSETVAVTVIAFTLFGSFLSATQAGRFFYKLSLALVGTVRGGGAKVAIICSAFFAMMTGEPISNSGIVGPLSIPLMKKLKYDPVFSGATVATASCGSMIMPPVMAAVAFLMGQMTGLGFAKIAISAIIPATLYYMAVYFQVDFYAAKKKYVAIDRADIPKLSDVIKEGWIYLIPIVFLIYWLLIKRLTPATAVYYATGVMILVSLIKKEDREHFVLKMGRALVDCGLSIIVTACLCAASGVIMGLVTVTGFGLKLSSALSTIAGGNLLVLAILAAACIYIMGMGMPPLVSYLMLAILVAPSMVSMGVELLAAHFFILYMSISAFITPPVAMAGYVCGQMVGESGMKVSLRAMRLGIVCYLIPFVSIYQPSLLLIGAVSDVIQSILTAIIGIICIAAGLEGYFFKNINIAFRILLIAAGFLMFIPGTVTDVIGIVCALPPLVQQFLIRNKDKDKIEERAA